jgi:hypothetical protein
MTPPPIYPFPLYRERPGRLGTGAAPWKARIAREALASDAAIEAGAAVYRAEDVHAWIEHLAKGAKPARPRPWRR